MTGGSQEAGINRNSGRVWWVRRLRMADQAGSPRPHQTLLSLFEGLWKPGKKEGFLICLLLLLLFFFFLFLRKGVN